MIHATESLTSDNSLSARVKNLSKHLFDFPFDTMHTVNRQMWEGYVHLAKTQFLLTLSASSKFWQSNEKSKKENR